MKRSASPSGASRLLLEDFLPYRLSVLTNTISDALARRYHERFGLTIPQWRVMAVLGEAPGLSSREVAERTAMDKVSVSRAVTALVERGHLLRSVDFDDRRRGKLRLSAKGRGVYRKIVPLARSVEETLIGALCPTDRVELDRLLDKLVTAAHSLSRESEDGKAA